MVPYLVLASDLAPIVFGFDLAVPNFLATIAFLSVLSLSSVGTYLVVRKSYTCRRGGDARAPATGT